MEIYRIDGPEPKQDVAIYPIDGLIKARVPLLSGVGNMTIEDLNLCDSDTYTETLPNGKQIIWTLPHSRNFPRFIQQHFSGPQYVSQKEDFVARIAAMKPGDYSEPFPYQQFMYEYMRFGTPYRSILLEYGLGAGKTRVPIMVGESFRAQGLPVLVLTPAFLHLNFMDEIWKWGGDDIRITKDMPPEEAAARQRIINETYHIVHYNAGGVGPGKPNGGKGGVFEALARLGIGFPKGSPQAEAFPYIKAMQTAGKILQPPSNMLIIIEEAHNLNRSFISGAGDIEGGGTGRVKAYLYSLLMMARDCKFIALTGTPLISNPFELAPLYNVLRGPIKGKYTAFPLSEKVFNEHFVDYESLRLTNQEIFMRRIVGLGSYFKGITDDATGLIYPHRDENFVNVVMSPYQTFCHDVQLDAEKQSKNKRKKPKLGGVGPEVAGGETMTDAQANFTPKSSYRLGSRQACNFVFPEAIPRPRNRRAELNWDPFLEAGQLFEFQVDDGEGGVRPATEQEDFDELKAFLLDQAEQRGIEIPEDDELWGFLADEDPGSQVYGLTYLVTRIYTDKEGPYALPLKAPRAKKGRPPIFDYLSPEDLKVIRMYMGELKDRLNGAVTQLIENPKAHFTIKALREQYSIKMAQIYLTITGDVEHGAPHIVYDGREDDIAAETQEKDPAPAEIIGSPDLDITGEVEEEEEDTDGPLEVPKAKGDRSDPDDPLLKHMDVFKTDEEIAALGRAKGKGRTARVVGGPALVYSFFNPVEGVGIFSKVLDYHGFTEFTEMGRVDPATMPRAPRYAFIRGGMTPELKVNTMRIFNSKENVHGQLIRVIFVTQAAAEGISLFNIRQEHIMEPFWDNVVVEQVIGRGFRLKAHQYIRDQKDRVIHVFRYMAKRASPAAMHKFNKSKYSNTQALHNTSTDEYIQELADKKDVFREGVKIMRARAAVDCLNNGAYNQIAAGCYNFGASATQGGRIYNEEIDVDRKEAPTKLVGKEHNRFVRFNVGSAIYVIDERAPKVWLAVRNGNTVGKILSTVVYEASPEVLNADSHTLDKIIDPSQLRIMGYRIDQQIGDAVNSRFVKAGTPGVTPLNPA